MTQAQLTTYYADLLAFQYRGQLKARQTVELFTKQFMGDDLAFQIRDGFNLATAVGAQLDTLAKYIGVPRSIGAVVPQGYFGLWRYASALTEANFQGTWTPDTNTPAPGSPSAGKWFAAYVQAASTSPIVAAWLAGDILLGDGSAWTRSTLDNANGLTTYNDLASNANGVFFSYSSFDRSTSDLTDASYRAILKLQIVLNRNDGTLASIIDLLVSLFPGQIQLRDNCNMTMDYFVQSTVPLTQAVLLAYLPRPMGVGITVTIVSPPTPGGSGFLTTESGEVLTTEGGEGILVEPVSP